MDQEFENRVKILKYMISKDIRDYRDVTMLIQSYFTNPDAVLDEIENDSSESEELVKEQEMIA